MISLANEYSNIPQYKIVKKKKKKKKQREKVPNVNMIFKNNTVTFLHPLRLALNKMS